MWSCSQCASDWVMDTLMWLRSSSPGHADRSRRRWSNHQFSKWTNNRLEVVIQNRLTRSETHLLKCFYFRAEMKMRQKWQNIKNIQRQQYGNVAVLSVKYTFTLIYLGFGLLVSQQSIEMCHFAHWKLEMDVSLSFLTDKHPSAAACHIPQVHISLYLNWYLMLLLIWTVQ